jgi:EAL domain-containing protein (putative c-di-GMP-specific phosphodiesterase class I)
MSLNRLPLDALKIDRAFLRGVDGPGGSRPVLQVMVALGRALGLDVVAEGIESASQLAVVRALGCSRFQGFHLATPMSPADLAALLQSERRLLAG